MNMDLGSATMLIVMLVAVIGLTGLAHAVMTGSAVAETIRLPPTCAIAGLNEAVVPGSKPMCCGCANSGDIVFCYPSFGSIPQFPLRGDANRDGVLDGWDCF